MISRNKKTLNLKAKSIVFALFVTTSLISPPVLASAGQDTKLSDIANKFLQKVKPKFEANERKYAKIIEKNAEVQVFDRIADGEELIFSFTKNKLLFSDSLFTVKQNNSVYISLSDFIGSLDFPITFSFEEGVAKGWFLREENTFHMDVTKNEATIADRKVLFGDHEIVKSEVNYDVFVEYQLLEKLFGIDMSIDIKKLEVTIDGGAVLPVEEKLARANRKGGIFQGNKKPVLPEIVQEYEMFTEPFVDVQLFHSHSESPDRETISESRYSLIGANDFLYGGTKSFLSGTDEDTINRFRFTWTKEAQEEKDFGVLGIDEVQVGDIIPTRMNLFRGSSQELGVRFDSGYDDDEQQTDTTEFEGDIQPGWDVELYNNNILVDIVTAAGDGRYEFNEVPLNFGENNFRLVFYGPQGQIQQETKTIIRRGNRLEVGQDRFSLSATNRGEITYDIDESTVVDAGTPNVILNYERGLSEKFSLSSGLRYHTNNDDTNIQSYTGLTGYFDSGIYELNVGGESQGGWGAEVSALTNIMGQSVRFRHQSNSNDFDTSATTSDNIVMENDFSVRGKIDQDRHYNVTMNHFMQDSGSNRYDFRTSVGQRLGRGTVTGAYNYIMDERNPKDQEVNQSLNLNASYNLYPVFLRGRVNYNIDPEAEVRSYFASALTNFTPEWSGQLELEHFPNDDGKTEGRVRLNYKSDEFIFSPDIRYNSEEELRAYVTMRFGMGRDPYSDKFVMAGRGLTNMGGVSARVFLDENGNGIWDQYEDAVPNVEVRSVHSGRKVKTDEKGNAFLSTLYEGTKTDIDLVTESFEDPYWVSSHQGNSVDPRAGRITPIDFPLVISGEIDGVVSVLNKYGDTRPARKMPIHLIDDQGTIVQTVETAYDGFYVVGDVEPGHYQLVLDEKTLQGRNLLPVEPKGFTFSPKGDIFFDQSFLTVAKDVPEIMLSELHEKQQNKGVVIELGRYKSKLLMALKWMGMKRNYQNFLAGFSPFQGILNQQANHADDAYPLQLGPVFNLDYAEQTCSALNSMGQSCTVKSVQWDKKPDDKA